LPEGGASDMVTFEAVVSYRHSMCKGDSCFCKSRPAALESRGPVRESFEEAIEDIRSHDSILVIQDDEREWYGLFTGTVIRVTGVMPQGG